LPYLKNLQTFTIVAFPLFSPWEQMPGLFDDDFDAFMSALPETINPRFETINLDLPADEELAPLIPEYLPKTHRKGLLKVRRGHRYDPFEIN